jgi:O-antigen/teichoic acid export membrane protein
MRPNTALTWRATLALLSNILTQVAGLLSQLIVTPILLTLLGVDLYGAWVVLQNSLAYVLIVNLRVGATLRFRLGTHQHEDDLVYKRTQVGGALVAWLVTVPLLILLGVPLIWWAPEITGVPATLGSSVRLTMGMLVLWMVLGRLVGIPVDILAALSLEYRAMGLRATLVLTTSFGMVLAAYWGWGLPGMAMIVMVAGLVEAGVRFVILRRNVPWLGVIFPNRAEVMTFLSFSFWLLFSNLGHALLISSQYVLVGLLFNPALVTIYSITGAASRVLFSPSLQIFDASGPGVLQIVGEKDFVRLERVRHELHLMTLGFMVFVGATTLLLNESFIGLWVGQRFFGGVGLTLLGWMAVTFQSLCRIEMFLNSALGKVRQASLASSLSGGFAIVLGMALVPTMQIWGIALGAVLGGGMLTGYLWWLTALQTGYSIGMKLRSLAGFAVRASILLGICAFVAPYIHLQDWLTFVLGGAGLSVVFASIIFWGVFDGSQREIIQQRLTPLIRRLLQPLKRLRQGEINP